MELSGTWKPTMTLRFMPDGKVDRSQNGYPWHERAECVIGGKETYGALCHDLADALDVCVAALREIMGDERTSGPAWNIAKAALEKIGAN